MSFKRLLLSSLLYQIGLLLLPGVGVKLAKTLVAYTGSPEAVFKETQRNLRLIPGIQEKTAAAIARSKVLFQAEEELKFIDKNNIQTRFFLDPDYPNRLKYCDDAPVLLFGSGQLNWNPERAISIVGTRNASRYGLTFVDQFCEILSEYEVTIISGMAYGIDIAAHKAALKYQLPTYAVVGHGLDRLYPSAHKKTLDQMKSNGGVITEFISGTIPDRENFPKRNRIIAGTSDATIVVESGLKGGSMITADIALSYNRDVFAVPGDIGRPFSTGCNALIHYQKAQLIRDANDLIRVMNWQKSSQAKTIQKQLFIELSPNEQEVVNCLQTGKRSMDELSYAMQTSVSQMSVILLSLEFKGLILSLPGKMYVLS